MDRYDLNPHDLIIFTLTRLSYTEKNKGYDKVIQILPLLKAKLPNVKYILAGKPDEQEKKRLIDLKEANHFKKDIIFTGFIKDEEITDHYLLADAFIFFSVRKAC